MLLVHSNLYEPVLYYTLQFGHHVLHNDYNTVLLECFASIKHFARVDPFAAKPKLLVNTHDPCQNAIVTSQRVLIWLTRKGFSPAKYSSNTEMYTCIRSLREPVYRVVGFEVETKSYSMDSMMSVTPNNDQGVPMADVKSEDRKHCKLNSEQTSVLQLQKGSKWMNARSNCKVEHLQ